MQDLFFHQAVCLREAHYVPVFGHSMVPRPYFIGILTVFLYFQCIFGPFSNDMDIYVFELNVLSAALELSTYS